MRVTRLFQYPVKGMRGNEVNELDILLAGPRFDRQWMIVDVHGKFISQRSHPKLAQFTAKATHGELSLKFETHELFLENSNQDTLPELDVVIWKDTVRAVEIVNGSQFISDLLGASLRLVRIYSDSERPIDAKSTSGNKQFTRFTDAFPMLIVGSETLDEFNSKVQKPVEVEQFRPNMVIQGAGPSFEDTADVLSVNGVNFGFGKKCSRCVVTTLDPKTGESKGPEPLKTLATYRRAAKGSAVYFGSYFFPLTEGAVSVGDKVTL